MTIEQTFENAYRSITAFCEEAYQTNGRSAVKSINDYVEPGLQKTGTFISKCASYYVDTCQTDQNFAFINIVIANLASFTLFSKLADIIENRYGSHVDSTRATQKLGLAAIVGGTSYITNIFFTKVTGVKIDQKICVTLAIAAFVMKKFFLSKLANYENVCSENTVLKRDQLRLNEELDKRTTQRDTLQIELDARYQIFKLTTKNAELNLINVNLLKFYNAVNQQKGLPTQTESELSEQLQKEQEEQFQKKQTEQQTNTNNSDNTNTNDSTAEQQVNKDDAENINNPNVDINTPPADQTNPAPNNTAG